MRFGSILRSATAYYFVLFIVTALITAANWEHRAQQGTYYFWYEPLAEQVERGDGYTYPSLDSSRAAGFPLHLSEALKDYQAQGRAPEYSPGVPATYPLWGYPLLLAGFLILGIPHAAGILVLQGLLGLLSVAAFYRCVGLREKLWHIPLLYPWLVHMSVRWPDAVASCLVVILVYLMHKAFRDDGLRYLVGAAVALGALYNLRSEYLLLPVILLPLLLIRSDREGDARRKLPAMKAALILASAWLLYLPWVAHISDNRWRAVPTNGGAVLYISLGQLHGNPWSRSHNDTAAYEYVRRFGVSDAMGATGDRLLRAQFTEDIRNHPGAFARKVWRNLRRALDGAVDGGEFRIGAEPTVGTRFGRARLARAMGAYSEATASLYRWIFRFGILALLGFGVLLRARRLEGAQGAWVVLVGGLLAYTCLVQAFTQYEPRHMMVLWVPLVMALLAIAPLVVEQVRRRAALFSSRP